MARRNTNRRQRRQTLCCTGGVCPACDCCICICTKDLKKALTPEARKLLIKALG